MKRMLNQSQRSQGRVVDKQLHIYARKMMAQQVRQQQNQMQQFQQMFAAMQQQQSQIILKLLEKQN